MTLVTTKKILDDEYEIHATAHGTWEVREKPEQEGAFARSIGTGEKLDQAVAAARKTIKTEQTPVSIPFWYRGENGWTIATAIGLHGATRQVQADVPGEGRIYIENSFRKVFDPSTELATLERYEELTTQQAEIGSKLREIQDQHKTLDLATRIKAERERAAAAQS